jgi:hypothetical protein
VAKPSKDRRAVLEEMRREQERAEKRRTLTIVAGAVAVALLIVGAASYPLLRDKLNRNELAGKDLASLGVSATAAGCTEVTVKKATGNSDHRPEGSKLTYADSPPADGPHYPIPAPISRKFYATNDRPPLGYLVHNLEHGYSILWYDQTVAKDSEQLAVVKEIGKKFDGTTLEDKFIVAPWTAEDGDPFPDGAHVALTHWSMGGTNGNPKGQLGITQYCSRPSGEAVADFVKDYPYSDSPEPGAA